MVRILKGHDERLAELLDIAQGLFFNKGYESTSVNDIIEKAGVAKGTFYHYFKTKEDLLDKLVLKWTLNSLERLKKLVMSRKNLGALEKLNLFFITIRNYKVENLELMKVLLLVLYREENLILRDKMFKKSINHFIPDLVEILNQGIREGVFHIEDVKETAELVFYIFMGLGDAVVQLLLESREKPENIDRIEKKLRVFQGSLERILDTTKGSISIVDRHVIEVFTRGIKKPSEAGAGMR